MKKEEILDVTFDAAKQSRLFRRISHQMKTTLPKISTTTYPAPGYAGHAAVHAGGFESHLKKRIVQTPFKKISVDAGVSFNKTSSGPLCDSGSVCSTGKSINPSFSITSGMIDSILVENTLNTPSIPSISTPLTARSADGSVLSNAPSVHSNNTSKVMSYGREKKQKMLEKEEWKRSISYNKYSKHSAQPIQKALNTAELIM
jgi:hypothetical protein